MTHLWFFCVFLILASHHWRPLEVRPRTSLQFRHTPIGISRSPHDLSTFMLWSRPRFKTPSWLLSGMHACVGSGLLTIFPHGCLLVPITKLSVVPFILTYFLFILHLPSYLDQKFWNHPYVPSHNTHSIYQKLRWVYFQMHESNHL